MEKIPLRVLLDTNVYGLIIMDSEPQIFSGLKEKGIIVCGCTVIRQELRNIPRKNIVGKAKLRNATLALYDSLVDTKRNYAVTEIVQTIALAYKENYHATHSWSEVENDFLIVATAALHNIDIVVSNDKKTMISEEAMQAYKTVNQKFELRTPNFIKLEEFAELVK